jgi:hypothetical protein
MHELTFLKRRELAEATKSARWLCCPWIHSPLDPEYEEASRASASMSSNRQQWESRKSMCAASKYGSRFDLDQHVWMH